MGWSIFFSYIGAAYTATILFKTLRFVNLHRKTVNAKTLEPYCHVVKGSEVKRPWAVVTGSSGGIGKAYAFELVSLGFNIVLHGRDARKLESLKLEIIHHFEQNFHRSGEELQIRALVLDVYKASAEEIKREVDNVLKPLHVTILINNIGTGLRPSGVVYSTFDRDEMADIEGVLNLNLRFPLLLTNAVLPLLLEATKNESGKALVINMLSYALVGSPWLGAYSGSKGGILAWSKSLASEMKSEKRPIDVIAIMTAQVTDTQNDTSGNAKLFMPRAKDFVRSALGKAGCGRFVVDGWWSHGLMGVMLERLPEGTVAQIISDATRDVMKKSGEERKNL